METKEQYRLNLSNEGKIRNRAEASLVAYAQKLLAKPVALTIHEVRQQLADELDRYCKQNPSHGTCRLSGVEIGSRIAGQHHLVTRRFAIYGRGRAIYTLLIAETVTKNITINCAPVV